MKRQIRGLKWVQRVAPPPWAHTDRPKGAKAAGLRYEKALAEAIPWAKHAPWFKFCDAGGVGWANPDFLWVRQAEIFVFEAKLTDCPEAYDEIATLYAPILAFWGQKPVRGVVVCKNLTPKTDKMGLTGDLSTALAMARRSISTLHWLGRVPLGPPLVPSIAKPLLNLAPRHASL